MFSTTGTSAEVGTGSGGDRDGRRAPTQDAFDTLATVLEVVCRVAAPLLPFVTEAVWRGLTGAGDGSSVHLVDRPEASSFPFDPDLVADMDWVREVCSAAHSIRKAKGLRARLPLARLTVAAADAARLPTRTSISSKTRSTSRPWTSTWRRDRFASRTLTVVFKVAAPRLGPETQAVAAAAKRGDWELARR